jgi:hypothetical protein
MNLLDKQSFKIPDVQECVWSPTQNILAYWVLISSSYMRLLKFVLSNVDYYTRLAVVIFET